MLERKIDKQLKEWKESKHKKALLIDGPRQIGKTTSIRSFGEKNYKEVIEINFKLTPSMKEVFQNDLTIDNLIFHLKLRYPQYKLNQGETLIFLDEIQLCDEALSSLKFWTLDGRYDVIAASSF